MKKLPIAVVLGTFMLATTSVYAEPQPKMKAALAHLQKAKQNLKQASKDKGGHRVQALKLINQAIREVRQGIKYDNKH